MARFGLVYGDNSKSINRFDGEKWEALEVGDLGRGHHYTSIIESRDGTLWIGGSRLIAHKDGVWRVYDPKDTAPLPGHRTKLLEAADGALWIIGRGEEAVRLDLSETHYQTYEGLIFQCDTPDGAQWFISQDNGVVRYDGGGWTRFGVGRWVDGRAQQAHRDPKGALWAAGSHEHVAATARLNGSEWILKRHPSFPGALILVRFMRLMTAPCGLPRPWIGGYMRIATFSVESWYSTERTGHITRLRI